MNWMNGLRGGQLTVLTKSQVEDIHYASLDILEHTGVKVMSERALKILKDAGAEVNDDKQLAMIPPHLCEEAIRKTPSRFTLYGRNSQKKNVKLNKVGSISRWQVYHRWYWILMEPGVMRRLRMLQTSFVSVMPFPIFTFQSGV